jgi:hypothetical protein
MIVQPPVAAHGELVSLPTQIGRVNTKNLHNRIIKSTAVTRLSGARSILEISTIAETFEARIRQGSFRPGERRWPNGALD